MPAWLSWLKRRPWPLRLLIVLDAIVLPLILWQWVGGSYGDPMVAAYLALGLLVVQLPLCLYGAWGESRSRARPYVTHAIGTAVLYIVAAFEFG